MLAVDQVVAQILQPDIEWLDQVTGIDLRLYQRAADEHQPVAVDGRLHAYIGIDDNRAIGRMRRVETGSPQPLRPAVGARLVAQLQKTTLFITHDLDEAIRIGHRIAIMKDGIIVQIGTPEEIVMNPTDDCVREFVQGISKLKLVKAHSILEPLDSYEGDLSAAPRADEGADLDQLIDHAVSTDLPVVITANGKDIGVVTKPRLFRGIQGAKSNERQRNHGIRHRRL